LNDFVGVTIMLSLTVFLLLVAETMPPTSDAVPLIGIYLRCVEVFVLRVIGTRKKLRKEI
jgi:Neurotransmitter-gated ion-channel transmembrane region